MISVTINNIWLKCYLKFYKIVADKMRSIHSLALALDDFKKSLIKKLKNIIQVFLLLSLFFHQYIRLSS